VSFDCWITSNSPGEVTAWVGGVVPWLKRHRPDWHLRLALVPCPYASGTEPSVARQLAQIDDVLSPWQTTLTWLSLASLRPPPAAQGVVLFLGGDPWHALLLGKKLGYPTAGYFEKPSLWSRWFRWRASAYALAGCDEVGNLMVDRLPPRSPTRSGPCRIGLFPGSRGWQARLTLGPMLACVAELRRRWGEQVDCQVIQSPFLPLHSLQRALDAPYPLGLPCLPGKVEPTRICTERFDVGILPGNPETLGQLDLALTIPGTNTAELACAGIPFVTLLHPLAFLGGGGLRGLVERLPLPATWKAPMRRAKQRRLRFTALPNQVAGRFLVPEVVLDRSMEPVTEILGHWIEDAESRHSVAQQLVGAMGRPGACQRLANWLIEKIDG
jgi:lipid-A-disaccharide synthase